MDLYRVLHFTRTLRKFLSDHNAFSARRERRVQDKFGTERVADSRKIVTARSQCSLEISLPGGEGQAEVLNR